MEHAVSTGSSKDLPLASLRLLVPPLQLMTASLWQVLDKQEVANYWNVADFVSFVTNMVPELLVHKHRAQLELGLRARYIIELCRDKELLENDIILSHLDMMKSQHPTQGAQNMKEVEEEEITVHFLELIQTLLKDPEERRNFFLDVFPVEYGRQYHSDLQTLFGEFLSRLAQLLPVPDLNQTMLWLGAENSVLEECVHSVSKTTDLKHLLHHHKDLGHLEQHVPCAGMGESIISSLSSLPGSRRAKTPDPSGPPLGLGYEKHTAPFIDGIAVEIISVTDYSEVELGPSADFEVVIEEHSYDRTDRAAEEGSVEVQPEDDSAPSPHRVSAGPHDCPDCEKKFKFASSLTAHRVVHTGERPHRCGECGRCFSFRQSLERHRYTHRTGRKYDCAACGETFSSLSARTEHKRTHAEEGGARQQGDGKFTWEQVSAPTEGHGGEADLRDDDVQPDYKEETEDVRNPENAEDESRDGATCWSAAGPLSDDPSTAKVRTSGRKRKPTMKIQAINLQKCLNRRGKTVAKVGAPDQKPLPLSCAEHSYGSHMDSPKHSEETVFSCLSCSFQHSDEAQVQQHMDRLHSALPEDEPSEQGAFGCSDCDKTFKFQSLLNAHRRVHTGEQPFACPQCGRRFSFKQSLDRHKETHASGRDYKCLICGEFFESPAAQREHRSAHMENGAYLCARCGRAFTWKSALVRHMKTHEGEDPGEGERAHACPRCELSFSCASYLSRHLQTHREARAHACNCGKSFAYRAALSAHQRIHLKERPHACAQCGKGFLYRGGLRNHMKIHSSEMPFMCSFCGKSFKRERSLKKHERCHTRENVFQCSQCDKSFVYKATLTRHELTHSGERPFLCSDCGKGFFSHAELLKHERFHTGHKPFQCPHCGKRFTQSCYLTIHLRYHTGVRPYSCAECDKSFLSANRLKRHQRIHSGEKPFLCGECGKSFRQSYNLKMHQRTHSKK